MAETVKPGISYKLDSNTMPLVFYRAAQDVFFVGPADGATKSQTVDGTRMSTRSQSGQREQQETRSHHRP